MGLGRKKRAARDKGKSVCQGRQTERRDKTRGAVLEMLMSASDAPTRHLFAVGTLDLSCAVFLSQAMLFSWV